MLMDQVEMDLLNPNSTYDHWNWLLIKDKHGNWKEVDHGY